MLLGLGNVITDSGMVHNSPLLATCLPPFLQPLKKLVEQEKAHISSYLTGMGMVNMFSSLSLLEAGGSVNSYDLLSPVGGTSLKELHDSYCGKLMV